MEYRIPDVRCDIRREVESQLNGALRTGRWSTFLREQLAFFLQHRIVNVASVIDEIRHLEWREVDPVAFPSKTKRETKFSNPELAPYWHKHFFTERFLLANLKVENCKKDNAAARLLKASAGQEIDEEFIKFLVHTSVQTSFAERSNSIRLTGEWIIFSREANRNTYLTLGVHRFPDASQEESDRFHADLCRRAAAEFNHPPE